MQSELVFELTYNFAGCDRLAGIEENIVITFSESSTEELKLNMIFSRATRVG
jgi:hypothetical protein